MEGINHVIGDYYLHKQGNKKRKLIEVRIGTFHFDDGHWCTDCVFINYINIRTGILVSDDLQLQLF